jgi:MYXO-CTERM domain-containing protein
MRNKITAVGAATALLLVPFADSVSADSTEPDDAAVVDADDDDDDDGSGNWGLFGLLGLAGLAGLLGRRRTTDYTGPSTIAAAPRTARGASSTNTIRDDDYS